MMATDQEVCPFCGGDEAFAVTDIDGMRAVICARCVNADAPPPEMYVRIVAAIAAEEERRKPALSADDLDRLWVAVQQDPTNVRSEDQALVPAPYRGRTVAEGGNGSVVGYLVAAVVLFALMVLTILQVTGNLG